MRCCRSSRPRTGRALAIATTAVAQTQVELRPSTPQTDRVVVLHFSLPGGHQAQIRGPEGQRLRIWLRGVGRFGFEPTIRPGSSRIVAVTVYDLDAASERQVGEIEVVAGGDPVTFGTSPPFTVSVLRIIGRPAVWMVEEQLPEQWMRDIEEQRSRMLLLATWPN